MYREYAPIITSLWQRKQFTMYWRHRQFDWWLVMRRLIVTFRAAACLWLTRLLLFHTCRAWGSRWRACPQNGMIQTLKLSGGAANEAQKAMCWVNTVEPDPTKTTRIASTRAPVAPLLPPTFFKHQFVFIKPSST